MIGVSEVILVILILAIVLGGAHLAQVGLALGRTVKSFKDGLSGKSQPGEKNVTPNRGGKSGS